jgi:hypothetical protein
LARSYPNGKEVPGTLGTYFRDRRAPSEEELNS